ncbi:ElyC/SanA/YdcF family protein [Cytophagales bacterium LB-30]|uniref:ElyC/SanA/YdcF family protein n=1 Tax=Shiella aurantiaca TaxID=3058365 RepID=A0ABT8F816_9BACT|nr:ElyC/SanA/YdcF family protein [Shiella aurantiaca]MDN4166632.1 ElyC/SanA/YdcF family protein [Shiella aurantiaca]
MLRTLAYFLINPVFFGLLLLLGYFLLRYRKKKRAAKVLMLLTIAWVILVYVSPFPLYGLYTLERQYPSFDARLSPEAEIHLLVLGGGSSFNPHKPWQDLLSLTAKGRLMEALRLKKKFPQAKLVLSGFSASGRTSIAEIMAFTALDLGISPADTLLSSKAGNTEEEARYYAERFGQSAQVVLITDASHMPRAMEAFRQWGLAPIPAPTNARIYLDPIRPPFHWKPSLEKVQIMETVCKEYPGLWVMQIKHRYKPR